MVYALKELSQILGSASFATAVSCGARMSSGLAGCISLLLTFESSLIHLTAAFGAATQCFSGLKKHAYRLYQAAAASLTSLGS